MRKTPASKGAGTGSLDRLCEGLGGREHSEPGGDLAHGLSGGGTRPQGQILCPLPRKPAHALSIGQDVSIYLRGEC